MKRLLLAIAILVALLPVTSDPMEWKGVSVVGGGVTSGETVSCSVDTDYIGSKTGGGNTVDASGNAVSIWLYEPICASGCTSGSLTTAYLNHEIYSGTDNAKVCLWQDNGSTPNSPDSGDTIVTCSSVITSSAHATASTSISGSISCANKYWIGFIPDTATNWSYNYDNSGATRYIQIIAGAYSDPVTNVATLAGSWGNTERKVIIYCTVGP